MKRHSANVQGEPGIPAGLIPWDVYMLAWEEYYKYHKGQTPERFSDRGGFSWSELIACFRGDYSIDGVRKAHDDLHVNFPAN